MIARVFFLHVCQKLHMSDPEPCLLALLSLPVVMSWLGISPSTLAWWFIDGLVDHCIFHVLCRRVAVWYRHELRRSSSPFDSVQFRSAPAWLFTSTLRFHFNHALSVAPRYALPFFLFPVIYSGKKTRQGKRERQGKMATGVGDPPKQRHTYPTVPDRQFRKPQPRPVRHSLTAFLLNLLGSTRNGLGRSPPLRGPLILVPA